MKESLMDICLFFNKYHQGCGVDIEISDMFKTVIKETQSEDLVDETYNKILKLLEEMLIIIDKREEQLMVKNN